MDITILITTEDSSEYTTYPFLAELVPRLVTDLIISEECKPYFEINHIERGNYASGSFVEAVELLIRENTGYSIIIIHQDAEGATQDAVVKNKFDPLLASLSDRGNNDLVKVIPVRMIEAWLCVDFEAFTEVSYIKGERDETVFPNTPAGAERIHNPKAELRRYIRENSIARRGRKIQLNTLYEPLGSKISIDELKRVPAFREFREDLRNALNALIP